MYGVLVAHSLLLSQVYPISNPEYVEQKYTEFPTIVLLNGFKVIQTFFTISGFLQAIQFYSFIEKQKRFQVSVLWKSVVYRYCRLMPVYGFMLLLDATLLLHIHDGPMWPRVAETQRYFCRNNWWANVLFINNYVTTSEPVRSLANFVSLIKWIFSFSVFATNLVPSGRLPTLLRRSDLVDDHVEVSAKYALRFYVGLYRRLADSCGCCLLQQV
jgi:hypothetical protein